jgi:hypothetical protein
MMKNDMDLLIPVFGNHIFPQTYADISQLINSELLTLLFQYPCEFNMATNANGITEKQLVPFKVRTFKNWGKDDV